MRGYFETKCSTCQMCDRWHEISTNKAVELWAEKPQTMTWSWSSQQNYRAGRQLLLSLIYKILYPIFVFLSCNWLMQVTWAQQPAKRQQRADNQGNWVQENTMIRVKHCFDTRAKKNIIYWGRGVQFRHHMLFKATTKAQEVNAIRRIQPPHVLNVVLAPRCDMSMFIKGLM